MLTRPKVQKHCSACGSTEVLCDAYAEWNADAQAWEISSLFDKGAYCNACEGETRIVTKLLTTEESDQ